MYVLLYLLVVYELSRSPLAQQQQRQQQQEEQSAYCISPAKASLAEEGEHNRRSVYPPLSSHSGPELVGAIRVRRERLTTVSQQSAVTCAPHRIHGRPIHLLWIPKMPRDPTADARAAPERLGTSWGPPPPTRPPPRRANRRRPTGGLVGTRSFPPTRGDRSAQRTGWQQRQQQCWRHTGLSLAPRSVMTLQTV